MTGDFFGGLDAIPRARIVAVDGSELIVGSGDALKAGTNVTFTKSGRYILIDAAGGGGGGDVATDAIWDAKGDIAVGTGANTAARLAVGADDTILMARAAQATGLIWIGRSGTAELAPVGATEGAGSDDTVPRGDHAHALGIVTTRGDLIRAGASGVPERFAAVTNRAIVHGDGTDVVASAGFVWMLIAEWFIGGPLFASSSVPQGKLVRLPPWATSAVLTDASCFASVYTPPTGADIEIDIKVSADHDASPSETSIFSNLMTIDVSDYHTGETGDSDNGTLTSDPLSLTASNFMRMYVTQVGSTERGRDLTVQVWAKVTVEF